MRIAGIDEAGRGPVIGPLVVAGILCSKEGEEELKRLNVRDSKTITPAKRDYLRDKILAICDDYRIEIVSAEEIDRLREEMTMNEMEEMLYGKILRELEPEIAYVDSVDVLEDRFGLAVKRHSRLEKIKVYSKHRADSLFPIVSAASIIAKTTRDAEIRKIADELGEDFGSGYPSDPKTRRFLESWVERYGRLPPHTRHSWETARKLLKKKKIKRLEDF